MRLEAGKKYRTRDGQEVVVEKKDASTLPRFPSYTFCFYDSGGVLRSCTEDGIYDLNNRMHRLDLVEAVYEKLQLSPGKRYRTRGGGIVRLEARDFPPQSRYPYSCRIEDNTGFSGCWKVGESYTVNKDGHQFFEKPQGNEKSLVEEIKEKSAVKKYKVGDIYEGDLSKLKPLTMAESKRIKEGQLLVSLSNAGDYRQRGSILNAINRNNKFSPTYAGYIWWTNGGYEDGTYHEKLALMPEMDKNGLEQLVEDANRGLEAIVKLKDHHSRIEFQSGIEISSDGIQRLYREAKRWVNPKGRSILAVKPEQKKAWPQDFRVCGYESCIEDGALKLGCKNFDPAALLRALNSLLSDNTNEQTVSDNVLRACRAGVYHDNYVVVWDKVERLRDALKEYLR